MAQPKQNRSGRGRKATVVGLLLMAMLVALGLWQKNNIEALQQYAKYSSTELEQQLEQNDREVQAILQAALDAAAAVDAEAQPDAPPESSAGDDAPQAEDSDPAPPSAAEGQASKADPTPAPQEPLQPPTKADPPKAEQPKAELPKAEKPAPAPQKPGGPTYEQQLKVIIDKVYALRAQYLRALDDLQAEATAAYKAIPKAERTRKAIASFVSTYISKATALERTCDGQMDALVRELTALQKKYGQSMELVDSVKYTYANEKSLKKAWYMSELEKKGLI